MSGSRALTRAAMVTDDLSPTTPSEEEASRRFWAARAAEPWVIWSGKHGAWWRAHRSGYTTVLAEAGHYSEAEARAIVFASPYSPNATLSLAEARRRAQTATAILDALVEAGDARDDALSAIAVR